MKPERRLQLQVCEYLQIKYPNVIFWANDSGEKKPMGLAILGKRMRSGSKIPDLWISEPRGMFCGLYIELKTKSPFLKNGQLSSNEHIQAQNKMLDALIGKGYMAGFAWTLEMAIATIDLYMSQKPVKPS